jgi:hypothetical protein
MAFNATAELTVAAPVDTAFARFIDFSSWDMWQPKGFRPISGPSRPLREGDRFKVAIGRGPGMPVELTVIRVRPNKEICWRGGVKGVLMGEHSFFFEAEDDGDNPRTRVRSEEPFTGLLASTPIASLLEREASKTGERTLSSFAAYLGKHSKTPT